MTTPRKTTVARIFTGIPPVVTTITQQNPSIASDEDVLPYLRRDEIDRLLTEWSAPIMTDGEIEGAAKVYRTWRGRSVVPFFLWLDMWGRKGWSC